MNNCIIHSSKPLQWLAILLLLGFCISVQADTLTLQKAYTLAEQNYPNIKARAIFDENTELKLKNLTTRYYPQGAVNGQFTYQSDVVQFPAQFQQFVKVDYPKDHYQATLDINQTIYDGGGVKASKQLERAQHDLDLQNIEVDVYTVRNRVNTYFFTILVLQHRQEILDSNANVLKSRIGQLNAAYNNGAILKGDVLKLQAELLKIDQSTDEINASKKALTDALTVILGIKIDAQTIVVSPTQSGELVQLVKERPENKYFELQKHKLQVSRSLVKVNNMPKLLAFAQAGVSYPNLFNFLDNTTSPFYLVGAKLNWNISSWYTTGREKKSLDLQQQLVQIQNESFQRNLDLAAANDNAEVVRLKTLVQKDDEIIDIYSKIWKQSSVQLDNGTITTTDYIIDLNSVSQAKLNKQLHLMQLDQARVNYLTNQGKNIENESK